MLGYGEMPFSSVGVSMAIMLNSLYLQIRSFY